MGVLIEAKNLGRHFGDIHAVRGISFSVSAGDVLGFLGPNGAGKSTTMKMLTCFLEPSYGTAEIAGFDVRGHSREVRAALGYLPENAPLYGEMSVGAFLTFVAEVRGLKSEERRRAVETAVDRTSLAAVFEQRVETLSKGFRRRVGLAQALLHDPEILILDEPTDGLDPNQKHEVRQLIQGMSDKCIVLSTHILEEVDAVCNRAIIIADGMIVADDTPDGLRARAAAGDAPIQLRVAHANSGAVAAFLASQAQISDVRQVEGSVSTLFYFSAGSAFSADALFHAALEQQWDLQEFSNASGNLDSVFRAITTKQAQRAEVGTAQSEDLQ